jgi:aryl-alcohol dehydrogenase-like predicted oxidoreductase
LINHYSLGKGLFQMSTQLKFDLRTLGKTDIRITPIGLGMMEFSGGGGMIGSAFPILSQEEKNAIVMAALDGGINWFDTAELYGAGLSEQSLAAGLKAAGKKNGDVVVATKWWPLFRTSRNIPVTIADRLRFLDGFGIDLYMVHQPFSLSTHDREMDAMADLVEAGKIRSVGVSNFDAKQMRLAYETLQKRGLPLAVNQVKYSLADRRIEQNGILETAKELGVTIIAYTSLESGLLTGKYHKNPELLEKKHFFYRSRLQRGIEKTRSLVAALEEIGAAHAVTAAQVALNWTVSFHGETVVTIPGATKVRQAQEAAAAMHFRLTEQELGRLDELSSAIR